LTLDDENRKVNSGSEPPEDCLSGQKKAMNNQRKDRRDPAFIVALFQPQPTIEMFKTVARAL
jgi:hypothetical protein